MDMTGESRIPAPRDAVWKALNDPAVLKQSIPGCEELEKVSDTEFVAKVTAKVGPVKARFNGRVTLSDLDPPNGYKISGEGQGGAAGFAKGGAEVRLEPDGNGTLLKYTVHAAIGGKLAQIGARLIDGTARKMADEFFGAFAAVVGAGAAAGEPAAVSEAHPAAAEAPTATQAPAPAPLAGEAPPAADSRGVKPWIWAGTLIVIAILLLIYYGR
jgi:carbon monoxide dehydrogenase subunit G